MSNLKMSTVTVVLTVKDAQVSSNFYEEVFGYINDYKPGGGHWPSMCPPPLHLKDSTILLVQTHFDGKLSPALRLMPRPADTAKSIGTLPMSLYIRVDDVEKTVAKAIQLGATSAGPPQEMLWGDRMATITDLDGYTWMVAKHVRDLTKAEIAEKVRELMKADVRGGPTNLDRFRGRDKWNSAGYAATASG